MQARFFSWFVLCAAVVLVALVPRSSGAFGDEGAFNPRILLTGTSRWEGARTTAPGRWSEELVRRTSAPARLIPTTVRADAPALLAEPFVVWGGETDIAPLTGREIAGLQRFLALGGVMFVDDFDPDSGAFGRAAKRELTRVVPDGAPVPVGKDNVLFRTFYLMPRPMGRVEGPSKLDVIMRGGQPQVIFSAHDLLGALARSASGTHPFSIVPSGEPGREQAARFAVNLAMYVLCSNYKDDQVHAPFLMRRRRAETP
jgi:Domain of unknown function (DUF4159)